ncbi:MAG: 2OG-Fe(II) oxygenase [Limisphaerales bacterium]
MKKNYLSNLIKSEDPYLHYESAGGSIPIDFANALSKIKFKHAPSADSYTGTRADYKNSRLFLKKDGNFSKEIHAEVSYLDSDDFKKELSELFEVDFYDTRLRVELVEDTDGFFQVPHLDVTQKRITWLTYLGNSNDVGDVGTDIYNEEKEIVKSATFEYNNALIFFPGKNTWHGFTKGKRIISKRRTLIINYVTRDWRDVHELV